MKQLALIMLFGAVGAAARYGAGIASRQMFGKAFPYDTLIVNLLGCLIIGIIMYGAFSARFDDSMKTALTVGFLGAFTTFSAFGYATFDFLLRGAWLPAILNASLNLLGGLIAVWAGMLIGKSVS